MFSASAMLRPAMSCAVPWSTEKRQERQAERDADRAVEVDALQHARGLVVVEAEDHVVAALPRQVEHGVRRHRPGHVEAPGPRALDAGRDLVDLLRARSARPRRRAGSAPPPRSAAWQAPSAGHRGEALQRVADAVGPDGVDGVPAARGGASRTARAARPSTNSVCDQALPVMPLQDLGVPLVAVAGQVERDLVDRGRDQRVRLAARGRVRPPPRSRPRPRRPPPRRPRRARGRPGRRPDP